MPSQMRVIGHIFLFFIDRYPLALACIAWVSWSWYCSFSKLVDWSIEVSYKDVVYMICPLYIIFKSDDPFVTGRASQLRAAKRLVAYACLSILKWAPSDEDRVAFLACSRCWSKQTLWRFWGSKRHLHCWLVMNRRCSRLVEFCWWVGLLVKSHFIL